ncbi:hypothetical protein BDM02DRAFT_3122951 [Thelephora ganbajun]|uniref:Uncharacterized protein n=1 Tax=Thelephora ganbajun TaxID=370292 RepID=A0ACB6Z2J0_THEGA|nr:hypothetical protein BDM02DRAFT_3122951 [Thelephora ganbajun]
MSENPISSHEHRVTDETISEGKEAEKHGWKEWEKVEKYLLPGHLLFRSSSPGYRGSDRSQRLTKDAVEWLTKKQVNSIISFNQYQYTQEELGLLAEAKITYRNWSTVDLHSPSIDNLKAAVEFHANFKDAVTLVHCGFGHGRTGTGISAIQLYAENGERPTEQEWIRDNHVEIIAEGEIENLRELATYYKNHPRRRLETNE